MKKLLIAAIAALACLSAPAIAQEAPAYLWINFVKAKPGQGEALVKMLIEEDSKHFDPLVESGAAVDWGIAMPIVHDGRDSYSHLEWIVFNGWAGADTFMKNFMAKRQAMSADELATMNSSWSALVKPGSHSDQINEGLHIGRGKPARAGYIHLGFHQARSGKFRDATGLYKEVVAPVFDKLVADGAILNYGLMTPEIHRGEKWTHMSWYSSKGLAARDVVKKAFETASAARTKEQNEAIAKRWAEYSDYGGHSDQILMVVHHKMKGVK